MSEWTRRENQLIILLEGEIAHGPAAEIHCVDGTYYIQLFQSDLGIYLRLDPCFHWNGLWQKRMQNSYLTNFKVKTHIHYF